MRLLLIFTGVIVLLLQYYFQPFSTEIQFILFIAGIVLLGIPHGAADMLVATENAPDKQHFSAAGFHVNYLARLAIFALLFWLFPLMTNLLFIVIAAIHFGETDLIQFNSNKLSGKCFVVFYGILILFTIILPHFETLKPLCALFPSGKENVRFILFVDTYRYYILGAATVIFMLISFWYIATNNIKLKMFTSFLLEYGMLLFVLYSLPMILGFTFYFVLWHSIFSLKNIFHYLGKAGSISTKEIARQISLYSIISFGGFVIFGTTGFLFLGSNMLIAYVFLFLAVLTAPHMEVMHNMYQKLKLVRAPHHSIAN